MPTVIKTPDQYKCNVCGETYDTEALAFACEDRPSRETTEHERRVIKARNTVSFAVMMKIQPTLTPEETALREEKWKRDEEEAAADLTRPPWKRRSWRNRLFSRSSIADRDHIDHIESLRIGASESEEPRTFGESMNTSAPTIGSEVTRVVNEESAG